MFLVSFIVFRYITFVFTTCIYKINATQSKLGGVWLYTDYTMRNKKSTNDFVFDTYNLKVLKVYCRR